MSRNVHGLKMASVALAALTYVGAVVYGDIMFISVMQATFPSGFLGTLAIIGAVMTAASAITLPLALHFWFAPGLQFLWGIAFWMIDIVALASNSILAYSIAVGAIDPVIELWQSLSPATPLLAVVGWGLAFLLDPSHRLRHAQSELETDLVDIHAQQLREAAQSPEVYRTLVDGARTNAARYAASLTGGARPSLPAARGEPPAAERAGGENGRWRLWRRAKNPTRRQR